MDWQEDADRQLQLRAAAGALGRMGFYLLIMLAALGLAGSMAWRFSDLTRYCLQPPRPPTDLGDVTELVPEAIPHDAYVTLHGITEHRGMRQKVLQVPAWGRQERWYFRLVGSRGIFIEVPPDGERYTPTTALTVSGRVVDPERAPVYRALLNEYVQLYRAQARPHARVLQVGLAPGTRRLAALLPVSLTLLLAAASLTLAAYTWQAWRRWRQLRAGRQA